MTTSSLTHLLPTSLAFSLCTPLPGSFILPQTHGYFASPMLSLANTISPTVPQSNGICSLQCLSHSFLLCLQNCIKNSSIQTIPQQEISNRLLTCPPPPPPLYIPSVHPCVCAHVCECVGSVQKIQHDYRIIIFAVVMDTFLLVRCSLIEMTTIIIIIKWRWFANMHDIIMCEIVSMGYLTVLVCVCVCVCVCVHG